MNRAPELRQRRLRILERYPCLGSRDPQEIVNCRHSEFGAEDAWVELCEIDDELMSIGYAEMANDPDRADVRRISRRPRPDWSER